MGAAPSRRVTVQREGAEILLTDNLIHVLSTPRGSTITLGDTIFEGRKRNPFAELEAPPLQPLSPEEIEENAVNLKASWDRLKRQRSQIDTLIASAHLKGIEMGVGQERKEREKDLQNLDLVWQKRMDDVHRRREVGQAEEFRDYSASLERRFPAHEPAASPCVELQAALQACYSANPRHSLNCTEEVERFLKCADHATMTFVSRNS